MLKDLNEAYVRSGEETFVPTVDQMRQWFDEFNEQFFDNALPKIALYVDELDSHTWGMFKFRRTYYTHNRQWVDKFSSSSCSIWLNENFAGTEYNLKNTMIHEMVHYYIYWKYSYRPSRHHGREFLYEAAKINEKSEWNITPTNDYVENAFSVKGREKYKNKIKDEYLIGVFKMPDEYGVYHIFKTDEKNIGKMYNFCIRCINDNMSDELPTFYKIRVENERFATVRINHGSYMSYMENGKTPEEALQKFDDDYGIISKEEFEYVPEKDNKEYFLVKIYDKLNEKSWAVKIDDKKYYYDVYAIKYSKRYVVELWEIAEYGQKFQVAETSKKRLSCFAYANSVELLDDILYNEYGVFLGNKLETTEEI